MKAFGIAFICVASALIPQTLRAQGEATIEHGYAALTVGYVDFFDEFFEPESDGVQSGLQLYMRVHPEVLVGVEIGSSANFTLFVGEEITVSPIELNGKYVRPLGRRFVAGVGAGLSYSRVAYDANTIFSTGSEEQVEWLFGGQLFADVAVRVWHLIGGLAIKYQTTQGFPEASWNASNWRVGPYVGVSF
jgi:hypothetical protein